MVLRLSHLALLTAVEGTLVMRGDQRNVYVGVVGVPMAKTSEDHPTSHIENSLYPVLKPPITLPYSMIVLIMNLKLVDRKTWSVDVKEMKWTELQFGIGFIYISAVVDQVREAAYQNPDL
jgi:hypothetical protein